jgi:DtxR family Mn-dependent transcriptional regulator
MPYRFGESSTADPRHSQAGDALKHLHEAEYSETSATTASLAGALRLTLERAGEIVAELARAGFAESSGNEIHLTATGREEARHLLRAHRLYETYLANETGVATEDWHRRADLVEHKLSRQDVDALSQRLGRPRFDPHGDPIPTSDGSLPPRRGRPLLEMPEGSSVEVVHLEDEPASVYRQAADAGILTGARMRILKRAADCLRVAVENRECDLPLAVAGAIQVEPCAAPPAVKPLSALRRGESGCVASLSATLVGGERRRMLDLGFVPGTRVERDFDSMLGSPTAYLVRGAIVALRREQADRVFLEA